MLWARLSLVGSSLAPPTGDRRRSLCPPHPSCVGSAAARHATCTSALLWAASPRRSAAGAPWWTWAISRVRRRRRQRHLERSYCPHRRCSTPWSTTSPCRSPDRPCSRGSWPCACGARRTVVDAMERECETTHLVVRVVVRHLVALVLLAHRQRAPCRLLTPPSGGLLPPCTRLLFIIYLFIYLRKRRRRWMTLA